MAIDRVPAVPGSEPPAPPGLRAPVAPGRGTAVVRIAALVPALPFVSLLVLFIGMLWLPGLACDKSRRDYVVYISGRATALLCLLLRG